MCGAIDVRLLMGAGRARAGGQHGNEAAAPAAFADIRQVTGFRYLPTEDFRRISEVCA